MLDEIVQTRRNAGAATRLLTRLLKKQGTAPKRMITDKLRLYGAAKRQVMTDKARAPTGRQLEFRPIEPRDACDGAESRHHSDMASAAVRAAKSLKNAVDR